MPAYVIKVDPSRDEYIYWSTVTDSPYFWGDYVAMQSYLEQRGEVGDGGRLERADEHGTSTLVESGGVRWFSWADDGRLIFEQRGTVARDDLWALAMRLDRGEPVDDLLELLDDEGEATS